MRAKTKIDEPATSRSPITINDELAARRRINQAVAWLHIMDGEAGSRSLWRNKVYYLMLYVGGILPEKQIQELILDDITLEAED